MACCRHRKGNSLQLWEHVSPCHPTLGLLIRLLKFSLIAVWRNKIKISNESVEDLGEGSGELGSPPFLEAKLRPAGPRKIIFETGLPLLHLRNWMSEPGPRLTKI